MAAPSLVAHVAHQSFLVGEAGGKLLGGCEQASAVVAQVDDERATGRQVEEDIVEVARTGLAGKRGAPHIADVVVEDAVAQAAGYLVVGAQVLVDQRVAIVAGIVLVEAPVARHVEGCVEVDVPVAQRGQHVAQHLEQLRVGHAAVHLAGVGRVHGVPVDAFLFEEAIVLVHYFPQGLEVALGVVVESLLGDTGRQQEGTQEQQRPTRRPP